MDITTGEQFSTQLHASATIPASIQVVHADRVWGHALFSGFDLNLRNTVSRSSAVAEAASIADERAGAYGRSVGGGSGTVMANGAESLTTTFAGE